MYSAAVFFKLCFPGTGVLSSTDQYAFCSCRAGRSFPLPAKSYFLLPPDVFAAYELLSGGDQKVDHPGRNKDDESRVKRHDDKVLGGRHNEICSVDFRNNGD